MLQGIRYAKVLEFLNKNAGAIQGLSTIALVCITAVYVFLTWKLADAATAEQRARREAAAARKRLLATNVRHLREIAKMLPGPTTNPSVMTTTLQNSPPENWNNFDFNQLRELASEISDEAGRSASTVESGMKSLAKDLEKILDPESKQVIDWARFDWRLWNDALIQAREALDTIEKAASL